MARTATAPRSAYSHSGRFSACTATRSPGSTPSASRACATSSTCVQYAPQVTSCQMPRSLCRMATAPGSRAARSRTLVTMVAVAWASVRTLMPFLPGTPR